MLRSILIVLLTIDSLILIAAILLQSGQGQGLAATFGGVSSSASSLFGTRQTGNLLTKASWWCGGIFLGLSFTSSRSRAPRSVLDQAFPNAPATAPAAPSNANPGATPAVPLTPVPEPTTTKTPEKTTKVPTKTP